jgi:hypothetical protein
MKRRRQARLEELWQRPVAVKQPAAAAASPGPSATDNDTASASSLQSDDRQPAIQRLSVLQRVSADVLILILQFLWPLHKLTAITRLSRAFHPLPARAFLLDRYWFPYDFSPRAGEPMTEQLHHLFLPVDEVEERAHRKLFTNPRSLRSLPFVSQLRDVSVDMERRGRTNWTDTLRCILRSVLGLPSLQRLFITAEEHWSRRRGPEADWTDCELPRADSLRVLGLTRLSLSVASVFRICSLPLNTLHLDGCRILPTCDIAVSSTSALSSLSLPSADGGVGTLQQHAVAMQQSGSQLERLFCSGWRSRELLSLVLSHTQQLRELNLDPCALRAAMDPASSPPCLLTAAGAARLPHLTRLHLRACDSHNSHNSQMEQPYTAASQQLVAAYAAQLTVLSVAVMPRSSVSAWLHLVFSCQDLLQLSLRGCCMKDAPPLELQLEPADALLSLPRLKELQVESLPLTDGGLLWLLSRCPELEKCVCSLPHVTQAGREAAFLGCPKLSGKVS